MYWQCSLTVTSGYITSITLGTFIVFLWFPQWGHHNHMSWNTVSVLCMSQLGSSLVNWVGNSNVFAVFQVGSLLAHCPFPCDVLAVFLVGTPLLALSERRIGARRFGEIESLRLRNLRILTWYYLFCDVADESCGSSYCSIFVRSPTLLLFLCH